MRPRDHSIAQPVRESEQHLEQAAYESYERPSD